MYSPSKLRLFELSLSFSVYHNSDSLSSKTLDLKLSLSLARSLNFSFSTLDLLDCRSKTLDGLRFFDLCRSQSNSLAILHRSLSLEGFALAVLHRTRTRSVLHKIDPFCSSSNRSVLHQIADPKSKIDLKGIDENWAAALEHNPEAFARVVMLYVDMEVNGVPLKAFVDSGAQSTIISKSCAERCGFTYQRKKRRRRRSRYDKLRYASCPRLFDGCVLDPTGGSRQLLWM